MQGVSFGDERDVFIAAVRGRPPSAVVFPQLLVEAAATERKINTGVSVAHLIIANDMSGAGLRKMIVAGQSYLGTTNVELHWYQVRGCIWPFVHSLDAPVFASRDETVIPGPPTLARGLSAMAMGSDSEDDEEYDEEEEEEGVNDYLFQSLPVNMQNAFQRDFIFMTPAKCSTFLLACLLGATNCAALLLGNSSINPDQGLLLDSGNTISPMEIVAQKKAFVLVSALAQLGAKTRQFDRWLSSEGHENAHLTETLSANNYGHLGKSVFCSSFSQAIDDGKSRLPPVNMWRRETSEMLLEYVYVTPLTFEIVEYCYPSQLPEQLSNGFLCRIELEGRLLRFRGNGVLQLPKSMFW